MNPKYQEFKSILFNKEEFFKNIDFEVSIQYSNPAISFNENFFFKDCSHPIFTSVIHQCIEYGYEKTREAYNSGYSRDVNVLKDIWYDSFIAMLIENGVKK